MYSTFHVIMNNINESMKNNIVNIVTVIEAGNSSNYLPNKEILSLAGKPSLLRLYDRISSSKLSGLIAVISSTEEKDDHVYELCTNAKINVFKAKKENIVNIYAKIAFKYDADIIIKISSECVLIDHTIITKFVNYYLENYNNCEYISNLNPASYPDGINIEIFSVKYLKEIRQYYKHNYEVNFPFSLNKYLDQNKIKNFSWETGLKYNNTHRWKIEFEEDYVFVKKIYDELFQSNPNFGIYEILLLLDQKPHLSEINAHLSSHRQNQYFRNNKTAV